MGGRRTEGGKLGERAKARLQQAHALRDSGDHGQAALAFSEMAGMAIGRDMPRVACRMAIWAAQSYAHAGDTEALEQSVKHAIKAARLDNDKSRSARVFGDLVATLRETGNDDMADRLSTRLRDAIGTTVRSQGEAPAVNRAMRRNLAKRCTNCGATVDAAAVRWNEDASADCSVCGSTL